jgi:hypothetical protein
MTYRIRRPTRCYPATAGGTSERRFFDNRITANKKHKISKRTCQVVENNRGRCCLALQIAWIHPSLERVRRHVQHLQDLWPSGTAVDLSEQSEAKAKQDAHVPFFNGLLDVIRCLIQFVDSSKNGSYGRSFYVKKGL